MLGSVRAKPNGPATRPAPAQTSWSQSIARAFAARCGSAMHKIGEETCVQFDYRPASLVRVETARIN